MSRGVTLVASTPFVEGGPRSWLCGAPALAEASVARTSAWRGWDVAAAALPKSRALRLGLCHAVGSRGAFVSDLVLSGDGGGPAGDRRQKLELEAELKCRASISEGRSVTASLSPALQWPGASLGALEVARGRLQRCRARAARSVDGPRVDDARQRRPAPARSRAAVQPLSRPSPLLTRAKTNSTFRGVRMFRRTSLCKPPPARAAGPGRSSVPLRGSTRFTLWFPGCTAGTIQHAPGS